MLSVTAGVGEQGTGLGKGEGSQSSHPSPNEETSLGDAHLWQKSTCLEQRTGKHSGTAASREKGGFQQNQGHSPGSDGRVSAHLHMMLEVTCFSTASIARDTLLSHQDLSP